MNAKPVIEDHFEDVLGKAMRGLGLDVAGLAGRAALDRGVVAALLAGEYAESALRQVAACLNLHAECLVELATCAQAPSLDLPAGIVRHTSAFPIPGYAAMTVNSYSLLPPGQSAAGALIDAGAGLHEIRQPGGAGTAAGWQLLLTHTHADHVAHYATLASVAAKVYAPDGEPYREAVPVRAGDRFNIGPWQLTAMATPGHTPAGLSYLLEGAAVPVVFVGDALFCYSIGKVGAADYPAALDCIRTKILSLPPETLLCPGHGPLTGVAFEQAHNPFFAGT